MKPANFLFRRQPLLGVIVVCVLAAASMFSLFFIGIEILFHNQALAQAFAQSLTGMAIVSVMLLNGAGSGIRSVADRRPRHAWAPILLMSSLVLFTLLMQRVDFEALVFDSRHAGDWLLVNLSTGFLEEVWFRGACFYLLYRAWASTRSGLFRAAAIQALLFGLLHLGNLHRSELNHTLYQAAWATFVGFGFAGLVAYARSIWPAVFLHTGIDAANNLDNFFAGPVYHFPETTTGILRLTVAVFFVFGVLPGIWCLMKAPLLPQPRISTQQPSNSEGIHNGRNLS